MNFNLKNFDFIKFNNQIMNWVKFNGQLVYEAWKKLIASGIPPLTLLKCKATNLVDYKIYGNSVQRGTNLFDGTYKGGYISGGKILVFKDSPTVHYLVVIPCNANTTYVVEKEYATERFSVGFTNEYPYTNCAVIGSVTNDKETKIIATSGANSQYLVAFVYNTNVDTLPLPNLNVYEAPAPDNPIEIESVGEKTPNMIDYSTFVDRTNSGITFTNNKDGSITANGTNTSKLVTCNINSSIDLSSLEKGVEYYGSCGADKNDTDLKIYLFSTIRNQVTGVTRYFSSAGVNSKKFTLSENEVVIALEIRINIPSGTPILIDNVVFKPILCKSSDYVEYEPYGYKVPVKTRGKNIMPLDSYSNTSVWAAKIINMSELLKNMKSGKQYTISADFICESVPDGVDSTTIGFQFIKKNAITTLALTNSYIINLNEIVHVSKTFTLPEDTNVDSYYGLYAYMNYSSSVKSGCGGRIENIQIEDGDKETDYTPYFEPIINNIYLKEPLRKIGDYADYIDFANQKVVRQIINYTITGQESWRFAANNTNHISCYLGIYDITGYATTGNTNRLNIISNKLITTNLTSIDCIKCSGLANNKTGGLINITLSKSRIGYEDTDTEAQAVEKFKNWLTLNNINCNYVMNEFSELIEETIELPNILLNKGTNIIEVDTSILPSNMEVKYMGKENR